MALQGTIDSFPLADVLALLASSRKTGRLAIDGDRGSASLWVDAAEVVASEVSGRPVQDPAVAVFEALRFDGGAFEFIDDDRPTSLDGDPASIEECLEAAREHLDRWREIEALIPSAAHTIRLASEIDSASVTVDAQRWKFLAQLGVGASLTEVAEALDVDEFSAGQALASLVEDGMCEVGPPQERPQHTTPLAAPVASPLEAFGLAEPDDTLADDSDPHDASMIDVEVVETQGSDGPDAQPVHAHDDVADDHGLAAEELDDVAFPERFPIDDLLEDGGFDDSRFEEAASRPAFGSDPSFGVDRQFHTDEAFARPEPSGHDRGRGEDPTAAAWDDIVASADDDEPSSADDGTDEVLRQMSKLSPQAAEAIAAALNAPPVGDGEAAYTERGRGDSSSF